ncbi:hypothetical protein [Campylobacter concisus]|uniref:Uncharacterized protein n=1 Tax=Campylobacter concisus UNSW2 TaxID=1242965 RepID=U2F3K4_9BACT|nr:hypothetical protein [Campylobacter concisus]ERJ31086.1 hypothetical protein UNSW2_1048 [Campylobacter concisus UNSW2]
MNYEAFLQRLNVATRGDIRSPNFEELKSLVEETAADISRAVTPLEMIEIDHRNFDILYHIDKRRFVRKFNPPKSESDRVDFLDEALIKALIYGVAKKRAHAEFYAKYHKFYLQSLSEYELNNFDERACDLTQALRVKGRLKPYEIDYALDPYYSWDENFIKRLDYYMANIVYGKNENLEHLEKFLNSDELGYRKFIYQFVAHQNGEYADREDLRVLDRLMSKKILGE